MTAKNKPLTVGALDLVALLANLKPFASNDGMLPTLNGIHLSADGSSLVGRASDRYKLGLDSVHASGELAPTTVQLASVNRLLVLLKGYKGLVEITRESENTLIAETDRERYALDTDGGEYPDMSKIVNGWQDDRSAAGAAIDPTHLKAFSHIRSSEGRTVLRVWTYGPTRPIHVKVGDTFHGVLMPVRVREEELAVPAREAEPSEAVA